jgi:hypothetical protein
MKIERYSAKCKLCKARWTTEESDRTKAFDAHESSCPRYSQFLAARVGCKADNLRVVENERYQMSVLWFSHIQIEGHYVAEKVCDGRCMGATGHVCDCSCGGKNHGVGRAA